MQASLLAAVIVVGLLGLLNLVLTLAVIRRLRDSPPAPQGVVPEPPTFLAAGGPMPAFDGVTVDGDRISDELLAGQMSVIGFFSTACRYCIKSVPDFGSYVADLPGVRRAIAVVDGDEEAAADLIAALSPVSRVVLEPMDGPISAAFAVTGFPTFYLLDGQGRILAGALSVGRLPVLAKP